MAHILNQYFDRVYCLTGHDFYDRHDHIKRQLSGIDFEWIVCFPADNISMPTPVPIGKNEVSTVFGHMACIWNAKLHDYKKIVIIEDDLVFTATQDEMKAFFDAVPDNWDFLQMSNPSHTVGMWDAEKWMTPHSEHVCKTTWGNGTSFLGIQYHMYDMIEERALMCLEPVDFTYFRLFKRRGNTYCPSKKFFGDPISEPHESMRDKFPKDRFLPSRIPHYK